MHLEKYEGRTVEIIYMAVNGQFSQRFIDVRKIKGDILWGLCRNSGKPRAFRVDRILAASPVIRSKGFLDEGGW